MKYVNLLCTAVLSVLIVGCTSATEFDSTLGHVSIGGDGKIALHALGAPDAIISANGDLSVNGKPLNLDPQQRELMRRYYAGAHAVQHDGFATGMAGASTAMTALSSVVSGLASGEPDKIGAAVNAKAADVRAEAEHLCSDVHELAAAQNALAASLPEFRPYALIDAKTADRCHAG